MFNELVFFFDCLQVSESENKLKENLLECARLREGLEMKCDMLQSENAGHNQIMRCEISHFSPDFAVYVDHMFLLTIFVMVLPGVSAHNSGTFDFQAGYGGTAASQVLCRWP